MQVILLIGNGYDGFATVHRFSSDLHFKTLPSIIDGFGNSCQIHTAAAVNPVNLVNPLTRLTKPLAACPILCANPMLCSCFTVIWRV